MTPSVLPINNTGRRHPLDPELIGPGGLAEKLTAAFVSAINNPARRRAVANLQAALEDQPPLAA